MARKRTSRKSGARKASSAPAPRGITDREKAFDAFINLLAENPFDRIGLRRSRAARAGLSLAQLRGEFALISVSTNQRQTAATTVICEIR
jgi:hypothetical protein